MSFWVKFRNSFEDFFQPEVQEAVNFAHALKTEASNSGGGNLAASFVSGYTAFASATGTFSEKAIVALEAFATALLGYAVNIVKAAEKDAITGAGS